MSTRIRITNTSKQPQDIGGRWLQPGGSDVFDLEQVPPEWRAAGVLVDVPDPRVGELERVGDALYVRKADGSRNVLVEAATGPGGVVRNSLGELVWRPGWNQLVKIPPTRVVATHGWDGEVTYDTASAATDGTAAISDDLYSPVEGTATVKFSGMTGTGANSVEWLNRVDIAPAPDDVWIVAVHLAKLSSASVKLRLGGDLPNFSTSGTYRTYVWNPARLRLGWNFLTCAHTEINIGATEYGVVGNCTQGTWIEGANFDASAQVKSLKIEIGGSNSAANCYVAGVWRAPRGWCKSAIMLGADDVPTSFFERAIPMIEARGLPYHLNVATQFTRQAGTYMTMDQIRACANRGAEILAHTNRHSNASTDTEAVVTADIARARVVMLGQGFGDAGRGMAWPFNVSNAASEASAKSQGYKWARSATGAYINSWQPAHRMYALPSISFEATNSWHTDSEIRRLRDLGLAGIAYMHSTDAGGSSSNTSPGASRHYEAHLRRWLDQIAEYCAEGEMVALTISDYWRIVGIDIDATGGVES